MWYLALKAVHVVAVITWAGGMLAAAVLLRAVSHESAATHSGPLRIARRWDNRVTSPAMLLAMASGVMLATTGGWFMQPWLMVKLIAVLLLSGVHGMLAGRLRRLAAHGAGPMPATTLRAAAGILACVAVIAAAAIVKPWTS